MVRSNQKYYADTPKLPNASKNLQNLQRHLWTLQNAIKILAKNLWQRPELKTQLKPWDENCQLQKYENGLKSGSWLGHVAVAWISRHCIREIWLKNNRMVA